MGLLLIDRGVLPGDCSLEIGDLLGGLFQLLFIEIGDDSL